MRQGLRAVQLDRQVRQVLLRRVQRDEAVAGGEEGPQDGEAGLHVDLAPLPARGVPELQRNDPGTCHLQVGGVEDVAGGAVEVWLAGAEAEDGEDGEVAAQGHGDALGAALFVRRGRRAEDAAPGLAGLVPCRDGLVGDGDSRVGC